MLDLDAIEARFVGVSPSEEEQAILDLIARIREQDAEIERLERQLELERGERREKDIAAACDHLHETIHGLRALCGEAVEAIRTLEDTPHYIATEYESLRASLHAASKGEQ